MNSIDRNYFPEIDGIRAFAVIAVIINHLNNKALTSGLGVDIFFISGFYTSSYIKDRGRTSRILSADFTKEE